MSCISRGQGWLGGISTRFQATPLYEKSEETFNVRRCRSSVQFDHFLASGAAIVPQTSALVQLAI